jgi:hypothetical protein
MDSAGPVYADAQAARRDALGRAEVAFDHLHISPLMRNDSNGRIALKPRILPRGVVVKFATSSSARFWHCSGAASHDVF